MLSEREMAILLAAERLHQACQEARESAKEALKLLREETK